jgi:hypothetical protein
MQMEQGMDMEQVDLQVCATHTAQLSSIGQDVGDLKRDLREIGRDIKVIAAHAEAIGDLKRRIGNVEEQLNWGKWVLAIVAGTTALVTFMQQTAQSWAR